MTDYLKLLLILVVISVLGCSLGGSSQGYSPTVGAHSSAKTSNPALRSVRRILVLPLDVSEAANSCVLGLDLYNVAVSAFSAESAVEIVSDEKVAPAWANYRLKAAGTESSFERAASFARQYGVDAVLVPVLQECSERRGSKYGAESPAAVLLSFSLLAIDGGVEIWRGGYRSKDEPLSENLYRLKEKLQNLHFHTASELIVSGFREGARELEARRIETFTTRTAG